MASLHHLGDAARIARLLDKLYAGEPVTVVVIGESIGAHGGCYGSKQMIEGAGVRQLNGLVYNQETGACTAGNENGRGFIQEFMEFINRTWPHKDHLLINNSLRGGSLSMTDWLSNTCWLDQFPHEFDLALMETSAKLPHSPKVFESMTRYLLDSPGRPAVVLLHTYNQCSNHVACLRCLKHGGGSCTAKVQQQLYGHAGWQNSPQRAFTTLQNWYNLPALSMRDLVHQMDWLASSDFHLDLDLTLQADVLINMLSVVDRLRISGMLQPSTDAAPPLYPYLRFPDKPRSRAALEACHTGGMDAF